jgi:Ca2+/H+ antiporter
MFIDILIVALVLPSVFSSAKGTVGDTLSAEILRISRTTAIILLVAYIV